MAENTLKISLEGRTAPPLLFFPRFMRVLIFLDGWMVGSSVRLFGQIDRPQGQRRFYETLRGRRRRGGGGGEGGG